MRKKIDKGLLLSSTILHRSGISNAGQPKSTLEDLRTASRDLQAVTAIIEKPTEFIISRAEYENETYWTVATAIPMFTTKFFIRYKVTNGVAFNKKTKTFRVWGKDKKYEQITQTIRHDVLAYLGNQVEWFSSVDLKLERCLTIRVLNRMAKGKITNPKDFLKSYLNDRYPKMNISYSLAMDLINKDETFAHWLFLHPHTAKILMTCENPNKFLSFLLTQKELNWSRRNTYEDFSNQLLVFGEKASYCWSDKRLEEEHSIYSKRIAKIAFEKEELVEYNNPELPVFPYMQIVNNSLELFEEGNMMHHCVYSNYRQKVSHKTYFVFRYDDGYVKGTVGVQYTAVAKKWTVEQFKGRRNEAMTSDAVNHVHRYIEWERIQKYLDQAALINSTTVKKENNAQNVQYIGRQPQVDVEQVDTFQDF